MNITEATAIDELARRGFTDWFRVVEGNLRVLTTGKLLKPEDLVIREVYRFEGISDPDDMAIVYAIESSTGIRGTLIDAFDLYADPAAAARVVEGQEPAVVQTVAIRTIRAALDLGITLIATAPAYDCGRSEELVESALTESRGRVCIEPGS